MKVSKVIYNFLYYYLVHAKEEDLVVPITGMMVSVPKLGIIDENGAGLGRD